MGFLDWASDQAHIKKHMRQLEAEHLAWAKKAAQNFGTKWWTIAPVVDAKDNACIDAYDIHGEYVFRRWSRSNPTHLIGDNGVDSWRIWWHYGPMTSVPQQTAATYQAAHQGRHDAEMARAAKAVQAAIDEVRVHYPASAKALVNA